MLMLVNRTVVCGFRVQLDLQQQWLIDPSGSLVVEVALSLFN